MSDFVIYTDSTTDLPQALADSLGLKIIPYSFRVGDTEYFNYLDHRELASPDFYNFLRAGKSASTSLVTTHRYIETFEPCLKEGKDILYLCLSTGLSSSYGQSLLAAETLEAAYPERKLIMVDSLCASMGQGLLAYYAAKEKEKGKSLDEVADFIRKLVPNLCHWFTVDDLNHLRRGGRVSGAAAFMGTMLGIKPILHVDDNGKLIPMAKVRGRAKSFEYLCERMAESILPPEDQVLFISHGDALEDAQKLAELLKSRCGKTHTVINDIGPVIGAHAGPGTITLFFVGNKR